MARVGSRNRWMVGQHDPWRYVYRHLKKRSTDNLPGIDDVQIQFLTVCGFGADPDLAGYDPKQLLSPFTLGKHDRSRVILSVAAQSRYRRQDTVGQPAEHRILFKNGQRPGIRHIYTTFFKNLRLCVKTLT